MAVKEAQARIKLVRPPATESSMSDSIGEIIVGLYVLDTVLRDGKPVPNRMLNQITHRVTWLADRLQRMPRD